MKHAARQNTTTDWYEAGLPTGERKRRGHFSTPHALIEQILDACGYTADADLSNLRLLDPACGSGNFLARAAERLCLAGRARGLNDERIGRTVARNLWGLDADPVACLLAEMQVRATLAATGVCSTSLPLHIHQADSLTLPWQPCVDLLVANPPYLAAKNTDLSRYCQARQRGQADSYLLFLELALGIVRPGGWLGLVLPDPVLARANAAAERAYLLRECTLQHIWHFSGVFAAEVGAVVLIAQKIPPHPLHRIYWTRAHWPAKQQSAPAETPIQRVSQSLLAQQPGAELRYLLNHEQGGEIERLRRALDEECKRTTREASEAGQIPHEWSGGSRRIPHEWSGGSRRIPHEWSGGSRRRQASSLHAGTREASSRDHSIGMIRGNAVELSSPQFHRNVETDLASVSAPVTAPTSAPVTAPVTAPTSAPVSAPTSALASAPTLIPLAQLVEIKRGEEIGRGSPLLGPRGTDEQGYPVLRGGIDIQPYARPESEISIARSAIQKPIERYLTPKLLVVKSTGHLQAVLDTRGHVVLQTLYLLHLREQTSSEQEGEPLDSAYFLLALLNSCLLRAYVYHLHTAYKLVQPQIEQGVLARLPVPWGAASTRREIIARARELEHACSKSGSVVEWKEQFSALYEKQERAIRSLYAAATSKVFTDTSQDKGV